MSDEKYKEDPRLVNRTAWERAAAYEKWKQDQEKKPKDSMFSGFLDMFRSKGPPAPKKKEE